MQAGQVSVQKQDISPLRPRHATKGDSLDVDVGADDVLDLLGKGILKGEGAGSDPDPLSGLGAKSVHDREDLALQLHHLQRVQQVPRLEETGLMGDPSAHRRVLTRSNYSFS